MECLGQLRPAWATQALTQAMEREESKFSGISYRKALLRAVSQVRDPALQKPLFDLHQVNGGAHRSPMTKAHFPVDAQPREYFLAAAADLKHPRVRYVVDGADAALKEGFGENKTDGEALFDEETELSGYLRHPREMRVWTARALITASTNPAKGFGYIQQTLSKAPQPAMRQAAVQALASLPPGAEREKGLEILSTTLEDQDGFVRATSVRALASSPGHAAQLMGALDDPFPDLRVEAAAAMCTEGVDIRSRLKTMLENEKDPVAQAAFAACLAR
jgi:hypothetical protein